MKNRAGVLIALFALAQLALACGSSGDETRAGVCVDGDARCGATCNSSLPCPQGLYCGDDGRCAKACVVPAKLAEADGCGSSSHCTENGMCMRNPRGDDVGNEIPGGRVPPSGSGGSTTTSSDGGGDQGSACAGTKVNTTRVMPTVILIVDQSHSMTDAFGGPTRWNALRDFLLGEPDGLIAGLQTQVRFGFAMYSGFSSDQDPELAGMECPVVTAVQPAFDNFPAIADVYRVSEPLDDTPTGDSIDKVIEVFGLETFDPEAIANPVVFVLATDGEPDRCEELDPQTDAAKQESVAAVTRAFNLGVRTYVVSVGDEVGEDHQQEIANAGLGQMAGEPDAEYWTAGDDASLRQALTSIVNSQLSCQIALNGSVADGTECDGTVTLNGAELECNSAEGWRLVDPKHIELLGDACNELKTLDDVALDVTFPCSFEVD